jgi:hypothetical protein
MCGQGRWVVGRPMNDSESWEQGEETRGAASRGAASSAGLWPVPLRGDSIPLTGTYRPRGRPA